MSISREFHAPDRKRTLEEGLAGLPRINIGIPRLVSYSFYVSTLLHSCSEFTSDNLRTGLFLRKIRIKFSLNFSRQPDRSFVDAYQFAFANEQFGVKMIEHQGRFESRNAICFATRFDRVCCARSKMKLNLIKDCPYISYISYILRSAYVAREIYTPTAVHKQTPAIINQAYRPKLATALLAKD